MPNTKHLFDQLSTPQRLALYKAYRDGFTSCRPSTGRSLIRRGYALRLHPDGRSAMLKGQLNIRISPEGRSLIDDYRKERKR